MELIKITFVILVRLINQLTSTTGYVDKLCRLKSHIIQIDCGEMTLDAS